MKKLTLILLSAFIFQPAFAQGIEILNRKNCKETKYCKTKYKCETGGKWKCASRPAPPKRPPSSPRERYDDFDRRFPEERYKDRIGRDINRDMFGDYYDEHGFPVDTVRDEFGREYKRDGIGRYVDENGTPIFRP